MKPSGMKMEEEALFSRSFGISLQTGASQPNVTSEERKCVDNICANPDGTCCFSVASMQQVRGSADVKV